MYCRQCGKQLADGSKFCNKCGASQAVKPKPLPINPTNPPKPKLENDSSNEIFDNIRKTLNENGALKWIICIGAVIAIIVLAFSLSSSSVGANKITIDDVLDIEFTGNDGGGSYMAMFKNRYYALPELDALDVEYDEKCFLALSSDCQKIEEKMDALEEFYHSFKMEVYPSEENGYLSNGDTVRVEISCDEQLMKAVGYKLTEKVKEYKVSGLGEVEKVDLFSGIDVEWTPYGGDYTLTLSGGVLPDKYYEVTELSDTKVRVSVDKEDVISIFAVQSKDGKYEKEITIEEKPRVLKSIDSSNEKILSEMAEKYLHDVYLDKCGWNLSDYGGTLNRSVTSTELSSIYLSSTNEVSAYFKIKCEGKTVYKTVTIKIEIEKDGSFKNVTSKPDEIGCSISSTEWF